MCLAIPHDVKRKGDLNGVLTSTQGKGFGVYADAPFGVHVNPGVQFNAVVGHLPAMSLEAVKDEFYRGICDNEAAHPPVVACGPVCAPCG